MRNNRLIELQGVIVIVLIACCRTPAQQQGALNVANTDRHLACGCITQASTPASACSYSTSTQNTLCDCGTSCCTASNNEVEVTITPYNGGQCVLEGGLSGYVPCSNATQGKASSGKGKVMTGVCPG